MDTIDTVAGSHITRPLAPSRRYAWRGILSWALTWEIYPIVLFTSFLRFYQISTTEFDTDQAVIFRMTHDAIAHGLLPVTTNASSLGMMNPPATVYILMLGAVFSSSPYAGVIVTGILNVLAVILTYIVVRRYFGRTAATLAALLYGVAQHTVVYSRFMWNQNLLAPFVLLFLLALLWGVIERRRGWLVPAVLLWGWMIQLHGSSVFLAIPLGLACVLAFKTLRWRDVLLAAGLLVLLYAPYILWEIVTQFSDLPILLQSLHHHASIDTQALGFYLSYFRTFTLYPLAEPGSWQFTLYNLLHGEFYAQVLLLFCSFTFALFAVCQSRWPLLTVARGVEAGLDGPVSSSVSPGGRVVAWWRTLVASPGRCALLLLLSWQILPVLILTRHTLGLFTTYFLVLMPGPFILMGIFSARMLEWLSQFKISWLRARPAGYIALSLLVVVQLMGTLGWVLDGANGFHPHGYLYYSLSDLQTALSTTDQLAQTRHLRHVYIDTDKRTSDALQYLSAQMQTPHTLLFAADSHCLLLPDASQGPVAMLFGPSETLDEALLARFASATLVSMPAHVGGPPFHLYIVQPFVTPGDQKPLAGILAMDRSQPGVFTWQDSAHPDQPATHLFTTFWTNLALRSARENTTYTDHLTAHYPGGTAGASSSVDCSFSSLMPGEHLLVPFTLTAGQSALPASLSISGAAWMTSPYTPTYGPFRLETLRTQRSLLATFQFAAGGEH